MIVSEIYLWGAALIAFLVVVAMLALAFVDRKMLRRMLVVFVATVAQMVIVGAVSYPVYVEKDAAAHKLCSAGGQHRLRRQYDTLSAYQCLHDCLLCIDGLSDGIDDSQRGTETRCSIT